MVDHGLLPPLGPPRPGGYVDLLQGVGELRSRQQGEGVVQHANRKSHLYHEARGRRVTIACTASFELVVHTLRPHHPSLLFPFFLSFPCLFSWSSFYDSLSLSFCAFFSLFLTVFIRIIALVYFNFFQMKLQPLTIELGFQYFTCTWFQQEFGQINCKFY